MRTLVGILLVVAMLAHATLGCCRLRAGEVCGWRASEHSTQSKCDHECIRPSFASTAHDDGVPPPARDHVCSCRGEGQFLPVLRLRLDKPQSNPLSLADPRTQAPGFAIIAKARYDRDFASNSAVPPVRLHLFYQILLI